MKRIITALLFLVFFIFFYLSNEYNKITYIPGRFSDIRENDKIEINSEHVSELVNDKTKLSESEFESVLNVASIFLLNENNLPRDLINSIEVDIRENRIKVGILINFRKIELEKIFVEKVPVNLKLLKILNPDRLYVSVEGNNHIINGRIILDKTSIVELGKKKYKMINILQNGKSSDIFIKGIQLPLLFNNIKECKYTNGFALFYLTG